MQHAERDGFIEKAVTRFIDGTSLEELALEFGRKFPDDQEGFPFDFALRMERAGIPSRFISDLEMQCVNADLETLIESFRESFVRKGITRDEYYSYVDTLRGLLVAEYEGKTRKSLIELRLDAERTLNSEPAKGDVDAFFALFVPEYTQAVTDNKGRQKRIYDRRGLYREFKQNFPGNTRSFEFFQFELNKISGNEQKNEPSLTEKLEQKGALYVIEWLSIRPEYIPDVLIAMHPDLAHSKEELQEIFGPGTPNGREGQSLRQFLGTCRKRRSTQGYEDRRRSADWLSRLAAEIYSNIHGNEEVITTILTTVVGRDYQKMFAECPEEVLPELQSLIKEAPHPYARQILERVAGFYRKIQNASLIGVMPRIRVK